MSLGIALVLLLTIPALVLGVDQRSLPAGTLKLPVTRDNWLYAVKDERNANLGGAHRSRTCLNIFPYGWTGRSPTPPLPAWPTNGDHLK